MAPVRFPPVKPPRVSIGIPVFNGERYLGEAIEAHLAQTFSDFELIVSDNASTDGTEEIARSYAARDSRVRYRRSEKNAGASKNFNLVFEQSRGDYFKWSAHDDRIEPEFLARCVVTLDRDPSVVLCYTGIDVIDESGNVAGGYDGELANASAADAPKRFADLVLIDHPCYELYGLIRADVLRKTPLLGSYIATDRVLLAELGLHGRFHEIREPLFRSRDHAERALRAAPFHLRAAWFDPDNRGRRVYPHWRFFSEYFASVRRAPIARAEKLRCYAVLLRWPMVNVNWARMGSDVIAAVFPGAIPALLRIKERFVETPDHGQRTAG
jgi:glycosyltransferase involved in cell wall biosynthesis